MTISLEGSRFQYSGNGATKAFAFPRRFIELTHLIVTVTTAGVDVAKTLDVDYTVTNTGTEAGGTVTFTTAPASLTTVTIDRATAAIQPTAYRPNDPFPAESHEDALDRMALTAQDNAHLVGRALHLLRNSTATTLLPTLVANNVVTVNSTATGFDLATPASFTASLGVALGTASSVFPTLGDAVNTTTLLSGQIVGTLGYYSAFDGGGTFYKVMTNAAYAALPDTPDTPDGLIDHQVIGGLLVLVYQHNRHFNAQACGVRAGVESSTAFNNAFWRAASLAPTLADMTPLPIKFTCEIDVMHNKTIHMSKEPPSAFVSGARCIMDVRIVGRFLGVGGGTYETHLAAEMARLTALHGSTVALGSALAAQFLKADPQVAVFLGDKIERPLPSVNISLTRSLVELGGFDADFWCSGFRFDKCSANEFSGRPFGVNYRKYGVLYTKDTNNDSKNLNFTLKQWSLSDLTDHGGRMMPGGFGEVLSRNMTGDSVVVLQKDIMMWGGNFGWGRSAVTVLDKCTAVEADRWAGRTIYPDYFTRWNDPMWADHGGSINQPQWDYMAPSTGGGDYNFYGTHVMQGGANTSDEVAPFRQDGLEFGGQVGFENWSSTNPVNLYGCDIDSSVTLNFGAGIRIFDPTITVGDTSKHACFHPNVRYYAARSSSLNAAVIQGWSGSIGVFAFDRGVVGVPNVVSFSGDFTKWNARNRVNSGTILGDVQYRGQISGGTGLLPSASVTTIGDYFWITEAGTYGGQVMAKGDILYAKIVGPGTAYGANWHLGANNDVEALTSSRVVEMVKSVNTLIPRADNQPVIFISKPGGDAAMRLETGLTQMDMAFNGTDVNFSVPGKAIFNGGIVSSDPLDGVGYTSGAGASVTQATSRTTAVTINNVVGRITMFSAAGSATWQRFTVNNSTVGLYDTVIPTVKLGTGGNMYLVHAQKATAAGAFDILFATTGGTATDAPIIDFSVIKGVIA